VTNFADDEIYEDCLVTFLDILGFRQLLHTQSGSGIIRILNTFREITLPDDIARPTRSDEMRLNSEANVEIVSDAIVRFRTTETQYRSGALIWELIDLLHIQIACVANRILVRGALTVGPLHVGLDLSGPVFGPALVEAYEMESSEVIFPRIAIHEDVIERHRNQTSLWREGHDFEDEQQHLDSLIRQDDSGTYYLDYLRGSLSEMDDGYLGWVGFLQHHKNIVEDGLANQTNRAVRRKYAWLARYQNEVIAGELIKVRPDAFFEEYELPLSDVLEALRITELEA